MDILDFLLYYYLMMVVRFFIYTVVQVFGVTLCLFAFHSVSSFAFWATVVLMVKMANRAMQIHIGLPIVVVFLVLFHVLLFALFE